MTAIWPALKVRRLVCTDQGSYFKLNHFLFQFFIFEGGVGSYFQGLSHIKMNKKADKINFRKGGNLFAPGAGGFKVSSYQRCSGKSQTG